MRCASCFETVKRERAMKLRGIGFPTIVERGLLLKQKVFTSSGDDVGLGTCKQRRPAQLPELHS